MEIPIEAPVVEEPAVDPIIAEVVVVVPAEIPVIITLVEGPVLEMPLPVEIVAAPAQEVISTEVSVTETAPTEPSIVEIPLTPLIRK